MKFIRLTIYSCILLLFFHLTTSCKKKIIECKQITELSGNEHLVNIDPDFLPQAFMDTLQTHPQLQIFRTAENTYIKSIFCNVFYQNLIVFSDQYSLHLLKSNDSIFSTKFPELIEPINFSLIPTLEISTAINIAKQVADFKKKCIEYRLGIYNINATKGNSIATYKLVWKIQGSNDCPNVLLDANTGEVYAIDDCIRN